MHKSFILRGITQKGCNAKLWGLQRNASAIICSSTTRQQMESLNVPIRVANVLIFTICLSMDHRISNVHASIRTSSMMLLKETANHAHANHFAPIGLALAARNSMSIKLYHKRNRPKKTKEKSYMAQWEA